MFTSYSQNKISDFFMILIDCVALTIILTLKIVPEHEPPVRVCHEIRHNIYYCNLI